MDPLRFILCVDPALMGAVQSTKYDEKVVDEEG